MPPALDTVAAAGTAIGASLAALTAVSGDSLQIKNAPLSSDIRLLAAWADVQAAGIARLRSPNMHDNTDGIRSRTRINNMEPFNTMGVAEKYLPQDVITVELAGSATAGDIETIVQQIYYSDLPGSGARFMSLDQLRQQQQHVLGVRVAITVGSTAIYSGAKALNADVDLLKANKDYALLGITSDLRVSAITVKGPDTANLRVAVPGGADVQGSMFRYARWFLHLSEFYGLPLIPLINSANKGATTVEVLGDENGGTANVTLWMAQITP